MNRNQEYPEHPEYPEHKERPVRIVRYTIDEAAAGLTVREFLNGRVHLSRHQISSLKYRPDGIVVNGETRRVTFVLHAGDVLEIGLKDAGNAYLVPGEFTQPPEILFENPDILVVSKPTGMVCHPSPGHYADSLANQVAAYAKDRQEDWTIRPIGRLDADTSGIQVFAKNSETAALLTKQRSEGQMEKTYLALCEGHFTRETGMVDLPIGKDPEIRGRMRILSEGREAVTFYTVLKEESGTLHLPASAYGVPASAYGVPASAYGAGADRISLIEVRIEHGRTHQIRVHMAAIGHPLVGDPFYGHGVKGQDHACLHAWKLRFRNPYTDEEIFLEAPLPEIIRNFVIL